jgi:hypothetical protein
VPDGDHPVPDGDHADRVRAHQARVAVAVGRGGGGELAGAEFTAGPPHRYAIPHMVNRASRTLFVIISCVVSC